ncbi:putative PIF1 DNA helicase/replication protein A1-like protein [Senna tora]|uniref:ATP-dependent DNA helicase n=1 Tax=Senna tora TaxID=362788 RepID=A0A834X009_9FABA|nr:putative PIF1 DNA helicase/replication protein A1-like protein [Senna tora]
MGGLLHFDDESPRFSQLYIYDTDNEVSNRLRSASGSKVTDKYDASIVMQLSQILDPFNPLVKVFRSVKERAKSSNIDNLRLKLIKMRNTDSRVYNLPAASEVATLIVGDFDIANVQRDIIVECRSGILQRISELHPLYLPMHDANLTDNEPDIALNMEAENEDFIDNDLQILNNSTKPSSKSKSNDDSELQNEKPAKKPRKCYICLTTHFVDENWKLNSKILFFCKMEPPHTGIELANRVFECLKEWGIDRKMFFLTLDNAYANDNMKDILKEQLSLQNNFLCNGDFFHVRCCAHILNLIVQEEIWRIECLLKQNLENSDSLIKEMATRMKSKFDKYWKDYSLILAIVAILDPRMKLEVLHFSFKKLDVNTFEEKLDFIKSKLYELYAQYESIYIIEFQKRGFPHAHILIWLNAYDKLSTTTQIDNVISAAIPNPDIDPQLYEAIKSFMIHKPCGHDRKSSCMGSNKCSKHFPKKFTDRTFFDEHGYAKYCRRDTGKKVVKNGIELDNCYVVPYNCRLLLRYQAHINVEFCNQSRSIKYLFKYLSKGYDKVTAYVSNRSVSNDNQNNTDENNMYYDCKHISACEAAWRMFRFYINYRDPSVERFPFHLPNEHDIIFNDDYPIEDVQDSRECCERKSCNSIGCLYYVSLDRGELHYLRVLLTFIKGVTCYEDIKTINGVLYPTFKDACYAMGLLDDDKGYIKGIVEASKWSYGVYLQLQLDNDRLKDISLADIENMLRLNGQSLKDFSPMPIPNYALIDNMNILMNEQLNYDCNLLRLEHDKSLLSVTSKQRNIYNVVMDVVNNSTGGLFFVNDFGGSLTSSVIASQLILGSRTAHSRFVIPLDCNKNSTCNIIQGSDLANLRLHTKLLIWDEAPMAHKNYFEALDRSLRNIMQIQDPYSFRKPFGGKVVVFGGDFR